MDLFTSLGVDLCTCPVARPDPGPQQQATTADAPAPAEATFAVDCVLYAGGPVWAVDWCPLPAPADAAGPLQTVETLAVATHPRSARRNPVNVAQQGPGVVQLWGMPSSTESVQIPGGLPKLLALLWHEGRLAWDVKWCPDPSPFIHVSRSDAGINSSSSSSGSDPLPLQGLLAAALGNGDVVVWGVPSTQCLLDLAKQQQQQQVAGGAADRALSLKLPFIWQMPAAAVGGSLCSCCSWLPSAPHDKLLVGCWDGNVVIWQLSLGTQGAPRGGGARGRRLQNDLFLQPLAASMVWQNSKGCL